MRIMAIDYGDARTGVAFSDLTGSIAGEAFTIQERNMQKVAGQIAELAKSRQVTRIVLGYPKNMDATMGPRAVKSDEFAALIREKTGLEPVLWDERRTTVDAHRILTDNNRRGAKRKAKIDAVAAALILESFLGYLNR